MKLSEKISIVVMFFISIMLGFLMGGCTDENTGISKQSDCLFKATICHFTLFDTERQVCIELDVEEGESCNTENPCISSCRCVKNEAQKVMLPQIDDGNQCTIDECTTTYGYDRALNANITHQNMPEGQRCGPAGISDGQCRRGLCVMPGGSIHIEHPIPFTSTAE